MSGRRISFATALLFVAACVSDRNVSVRKTQAQGPDGGDGGFSGDTGGRAAASGGSAGSRASAGATGSGATTGSGAGPSGSGGAHDGSGGNTGNGGDGSGGGTGSGTGSGGGTGAGGVGEGGANGSGGALTGGANGSGGKGTGGIVGAGGKGTGGVNGTGGMTGTGGGPVIPALPATCPTIKTGTITVLGQQVQITAGTKQAGKKGAVMFYWHGTGSDASEVSLLGSAASEITAEGGVVASFTSTTATGQNTGDQVWYTGDYDMADIILACAVNQLDIDTRRIYTAGCSVGGLQAGTMAFYRSSYLAGAMPNSGGIIKGLVSSSLQDPTHVPSVITAHGSMSQDQVGVYFATTSKDECTAISAAGGFAVDCDDGLGHCAAPASLIAVQWQFIKDHPFGVKPDPYAGGLPNGFPSYCTKY